MNEDLERSYDLLFKERLGLSDSYGQIVEVVQSFQYKNNFGVRPDATLFLANNMVDTILRPVQIARDQFADSDAQQFSDDELRSMLLEDTRTILFAAQQISTKRNRDYISATSVVYALAEVLGDLRISNVQLWGRSENRQRAR